MIRHINSAKFANVFRKKDLYKLFVSGFCLISDPSTFLLLDDMSLDFVLGLDDISSYVIRGQTESLRWSVNSLFRRKVEIGNFEKKKTELFLSAKRL